ncbi:protein FAM216A [Hoplias malabaricus]|uniref:protein FAM216A n=1 Tax=Hoplias malabaricus TaxID=27720 RepID=UPI0034635FBA
MGKQWETAESTHKQWHEYHQKTALNPLPLRSSGSTNIRSDPSVVRVPSAGLKDLDQQSAAPELTEQPQNFNTSQIQHHMMITSSSLQHWSLTPGQKRYLSSMAKTYSEDHVRKLIRQYYLNVLHKAIRTGISDTKDIGFGLEPASPDEVHSPKPQKKSGKAKIQKSKRLVLPKINSHRKRLPQESSAKKPKPIRKRHNDSGLFQWDAEEDLVLSNLSTLSLESEDFLPVR